MGDVWYTRLLPELPMVNLGRVCECGLEAPRQPGHALVLSPLELGLALLHEGLNAFAEVLRAEEGEELEEDVVDVRLERLLQAEAHHALGGLNGERGVGGDFGGHLPGSGHELVQLDDLVDESEGERFFG